MDNQVAVKAIIQHRDGEYLIVREGKRWQIVGGRLDSGEKLEDGLRREVREETGIVDLTVGKVIHVDEWFAKPEGTLKHIVALFFLCETTTKTVVISDEHQEYKWIKISALDGFGDSVPDDLKRALLQAAETSL